MNIEPGTSSKRQKTEHIAQNEPTVQNFVEVFFTSVDWNEYKVNISNYDSKLIQAFREISQRKYIPNDHSWVFPINTYNRLLASIENFEHIKIKSYLQSPEIVAIVTDTNVLEDSFSLEIPYRHDVVELLQTFNGYLPNIHFTLPYSKKQEIIDDLSHINVATKEMKDKPSFINYNAKSKLTLEFNQHNSSQFQVKMHRYKDSVVEKLKTIKGYKYDFVNKIWIFNNNWKNEVLNLFSDDKHYDIINNM